MIGKERGYDILRDVQDDLSELGGKSSISLTQLLEASKTDEKATPEDKLWALYDAIALYGAWCSSKQKLIGYGYPKKEKISLSDAADTVKGIIGGKIPDSAFAKAFAKELEQKIGPWTKRKEEKLDLAKWVRNPVSLACLALVVVGVAAALFFAFHKPNPIDPTSSEPTGVQENTITTTDPNILPANVFDADEALRRQSEASSISEASSRSEASSVADAVLSLQAEQSRQNTTKPQTTKPSTTKPPTTKKPETTTEKPNTTPSPAGPQTPNVTMSEIPMRKGETKKVDVSNPDKVKIYFEDPNESQIIKVDRNTGEVTALKAGTAVVNVHLITGPQIGNCTIKVTD